MNYKILKKFLRVRTSLSPLDSTLHFIFTKRPRKLSSTTWSNIFLPDPSMYTFITDETHNVNSVIKRVLHFLFYLIFSMYGESRTQLLLRNGCGIPNMPLIGGERHLFYNFTRNSCSLFWYLSRNDIIPLFIPFECHIYGQTLFTIKYFVNY